MQKKQKIILVFDRNRENCNEFCIKIKKSFIRNVCTVHPIYYFEYCKDKYKTYRRVIDFISENKHKRHIIIDNYFEEYIEHLVCQLKVRETPITHFICNSDIKYSNVLKNWLDMNNNTSNVKEYLKIEDNNILYYTEFHPKFVFFCLMKGSNKYTVINSYVKKKNPHLFTSFSIKKNCFLFDGATSDIYLLSRIGDKLKKILRGNIQLLLKIKNENYNKLDFEIISILKNWKVVNTQKGLFIETDKLRIL